MQIEFLTNGYPDPELYWNSVRDLLKKIQNSMGWIHSQQVWRIETKRYMEKNGINTEEKE